MSQDVVRLIIGRAVLENEFRELLFADPDQALEGYDLTDKEIAGLKRINRDRFDELATGLEERISRAGFNPGRIRFDMRIGGRLSPEVSSFFDVFTEFKS